MQILKIRVQLPNLTSNFQTHNKVGDKFFLRRYILQGSLVNISEFEEI